MRVTPLLILLVPCLLLAHAATAAPPRKRQAQVAIATWKQPARHAARPLVRRTMHEGGMVRHGLQR